MNKTSNVPNWNLIIPVMATVLLAMQGVSSAEGYLAAIGPVPLRFAYVDNNNALFLSELAPPKLKPVIQPPMPPPQTNAQPETVVADSPPLAGLFGPVSGVPLSPGPERNGHDRGSSASDMLNITPQMISEYFKPSRAEGESEPSPFQHGESIFVPAELGFVPPTPGSRAIYNSK
jgi:hypothetical protein